MGFATHAHRSSIHRGCSSHGAASIHGASYHFRRWALQRTPPKAHNRVLIGPRDPPSEKMRKETLLYSIGAQRSGPVLSHHLWIRWICGSLGCGSGGWGQPCRFCVGFAARSPSTPMAVSSAGARPENGREARSFVGGGESSDGTINPTIPKK